MPGLNADRADIIVAGIAVIAEVLARVEAREVTVSRYGIREGLLLEAAHVTGRGRRSGRGARALGARLRRALPLREKATRRRCRRSRSSSSTRWRRLGSGLTSARILADAALLHDVGYHINYDRHHKHSYHLIVHGELLGITPEEQVLIANVARYHRGARAAAASIATSVRWTSLLRQRVKSSRRSSASPMDSIAGTSVPSRRSRYAFSIARSASPRSPRGRTPRCASRSGARTASPRCSPTSPGAPWRSSDRTAVLSSEQLAEKESELES